MFSHPLLAELSYPLGLGLYFVLNQNYIEQQLCINRAQPEMHCQGKCYLTQKIHQYEDSQGEGVPLSEQEMAWYPLSLYVEQGFYWVMSPYDASEPKARAYYWEPVVLALVTKIFHPPRDQLIFHA
ncbi:MAG: hypothetical protein HC880_09835 [Bacteroidia bacterium]|nr:hypothetical protein [Bacteroidia bacterium]